MLFILAVSGSLIGKSEMTHLDSGRLVSVRTERTNMCLYFISIPFLSQRNPLKYDFTQFSHNMLVFLAPSSVMNTCVSGVLSTLSHQRAPGPKRGRCAHNDSTVSLGSRACGSQSPLSIGCLNGIR